MTDLSEFVEVYSPPAGRKHHVPRGWLDDPVLGRNIRKTPSQRALDGDLETPDETSTVPAIRRYAEETGIDVTGLRTKDDLLAAVTAATAPPESTVDVPAGEDPLGDPEVDPVTDPALDPPVDPATDSAPGPEGGPTTNTPAAGDEE